MRGKAYLCFIAIKKTAFIIFNMISFCHSLTGIPEEGLSFYEEA